MPTYEYQCTKGHHFEVEQRITAEPLKRCRICRSKVQRLISPSTFILKGGGWYSDGYGPSGSKGESSDASKGDKAESSSDAKPSKSESSSSTSSESSSGD